MKLYKYCREETCIFIYIDKDLKIYCLHCYFEREKNFIGLLHYKMLIAHIKKVLQIVAKFVQDFIKLFSLNFAKANKFLDLYLIRLNISLDLLNYDDDNLLLINLFKLIHEYKQQLGDIQIKNNTISSQFLQNIYKYIYSHYMTNIEQDVQNSQNLNKSQKLVTLELYGSYFQNNHLDQIDVQGNSFININWLLDRIKQFLKVFYNFEGNVLKSDKICFFYNLYKSLREILHNLQVDQRYLVYIDINLPDLFKDSNQCPDSILSIYFIEIREDI